MDKCLILPSCRGDLLEKLYNSKDENIITAFKRVVDVMPQAIAIRFKKIKYSYKQIDDITDKIAAGLLANNVKKGDVIGIYMDKSDKFILSMLSILKAGCVYLPIGKIYPIDRISEILKIAQCKVVIVDNELILQENMIFNLKYDSLLKYDDSDFKSNDNVYDSESIAYFVFTSGSTGKPKGVAIRHKSVVNIAYAMEKDVLNLDSKFEYTISVFAPLIFDASVGQIYSSLLLGHTLSIMDDAIKLSAEKVLQYIKDDEIDVIDLTPTYINILIQWMTFVKYPIKLPKYIISVGEALPIQLLKKFYTFPNTDNVIISNAYGPTETCVYASAKIFTKYTASSYQRMTIGKPLHNYSIYIIDKEDKLCDVDKEGEICIAGVGVAFGYVNNPDMTSKVFVKDTVVNEGIMYRTGDIGKLNSDGDIECLGRMDDQVKINGYRIDFSDIEKNIESLDGIQQCKVCVQGKDSSGVLVAYYKSKRNIEFNEINSHAKKLLPSYMIPLYYVPVDSFKIGPTGKLDKKKLPNYKTNSLVSNKVKKTAALLDEDALRLVMLASEILNRNDVSLENNFFSLGGNSLQIHVLVMRIWKIWGITLDVANLYKCESFKEILKLIKGYRKESNIYKNEITKNVKALPCQQYVCRNKEIADVRKDASEWHDSYNLMFSFKLEEHLDALRLEKAIFQLCENQDILRASLSNKNKNWYFHVEEEIESPFQFKKVLGKISKDVIKSYIRKIKIDNYHLFKVLLLENDLNDQVVLLHVHHGIFDFASVQVFLEGLFTAYDGKKILAPNYGFCEYVTNVYPKLVEKHLNFWKDYLKDRPYPCLFSSKINKNSFVKFTEKDTFSTVKCKLPETVKVLLGKLSTSLSTTTFIILISALAILMNNRSKQHDLIIGTNMNGRLNADDLNRIGMMTNQECLRFKLNDSESIEQIIKNTKENYINVLSHQVVALGELYDLQEMKDIIKGDIFQVFFNYIGLDSIKIVRNGKLIEIEEYDRSNDYSPIVWTVFEEKFSYVLEVSFCDRLFKREFIEELLSEYQHILFAVISNNKMKLKNIKIGNNKENENGESI